MFRAASVVARRAAAGYAYNVEPQIPAATFMSQRTMSKGGFFKSFYENLKQDLERLVLLRSES